MSRETNMNKFIKEAQKASDLFLAMLWDKCPEFPTEREKAYMKNDMQRNLEIYFDEAVERAREEDEKDEEGLVYA